MEYATTYFATQLEPLVDPTSSSYNPLYAQALDDAVARVIYADERFGLLGGASPRPNIDDIKDADAAITSSVPRIGCAP